MHMHIGESPGPDQMGRRKRDNWPEKNKDPEELLLDKQSPVWHTPH